MKLTLIKIVLSALLSVFFLSAFSQINMKKDTVFCDLYPGERNEFHVDIENIGSDSIEYKYELVYENVTTLTSWIIEYCDCKECLIGLIPSGDCAIAGNDSYPFYYYVTPPVDETVYTETVVTYKVTSKSDSTNSDSYTFVTRRAADISVNSIELDLSDVTIYPNPTDGIVNISFKGMSNDSYTLSVMNVLGELVYTNILEANSGNNTVESKLDFRDLQKGAYFVTLSNGEEVKTERLTIK